MLNIKFKKTDCFMICIIILFLLVNVHYIVPSQNIEFYDYNERKKDHYFTGFFTSYPSKDVVPPPDDLIPYDGSFVITKTPTLQWYPVTYANLYVVQIATDVSFSEILLEINSISSSCSTTTLPEGTIFWRVKARIIVMAQEFWTEWSVVSSFIVDTIPPDQVTLTSPTNNMLTNIASHELIWNSVPDDYRYHLEIAYDNSFSSIFDTYEGSSLSYTRTFSDNAYFWRVQAEDSAGHLGLWSSVWTFTIDTTAPGALTINYPLNGQILNEVFMEEGVPTFSWNSVASASQYELQLASDSDFTNIVVQTITNDLTYTYTLLSENTNYYWHVRAIDAAGNLGAFCSCQCFTIDITGPEAPELLTPTNGSYVNVQYLLFSWTSPPSACEIELELSENPTFDSPYVISENPFPPSSSWNMSTSYLTEKTYFWRARGIDGVNNHGSWSTINTLILDRTPPNTPILCSTQNNTIRSVNSIFIEWDPINDFVDCLVEIAVNPDFTTFESSSTVENSTLIDGLQDNNYYLRVRARDAAGNLGDASGVLVITIDSTPPSIEDVISFPAIKDDINEVIIQCLIRDLHNIREAILFYRINYDIWMCNDLINTFATHYEASLGYFLCSDVIEYYIIAKDNLTEPNIAIDDNDGEYFLIEIGPSDTTGPIIIDVTHDPTYPIDGDEIIISCNVTDDSGVASVIVYYRINSGCWVNSSMVHSINNLWSISIGSFATTEVIEYYIVAIDDYISPSYTIDNNLGLYYTILITNASTLNTIINYAIPFMAFLAIGSLVKMSKRQ